MLAWNHPKAVNIFICYAHEDERLREQLSAHLSLLRRQGLINDWNYRDIRAGQNWSDEIDAHLNAAHIILLLISANFINSDYCHCVEMTRALERHDSREARVIPILLKPVDITDAPFSKLQMLPKDQKPVTNWSNKDMVYASIVLEIRKVIYDILGKHDPLDRLSEQYLLANKPLKKNGVAEAISSCSSVRRKNSPQLLENTPYRTDAHNFKKNILKVHSEPFLWQARDFLIEVAIPELGAFLKRSLNIKKFRRYRKGGIRTFGFFFFLILDVGFVSVGVSESLHSLLLTILTFLVTLLCFLWMSINEDTLLGIIFALSFGGAWCALGVSYLHQVVFVIIFSVSFLFAYFRFLLFKPTR